MLLTTPDKKVIDVISVYISLAQTSHMTKPNTTGYRLDFFHKCEYMVRSTLYYRR